MLKLLEFIVNHVLKGFLAVKSVMRMAFVKNIQNARMENLDPLKH